MAPSLKCTDSRNPLARARTSTISTGSSRPGYSSHSITSRWTGWRAVTAGTGGAGGWAFGWHAAEERVTAIAAAAWSHGNRYFGAGRFMQNLVNSYSLGDAGSLWAKSRPK